MRNKYDIKCLDCGVTVIVPKQGWARKRCDKCSRARTLLLDRQYNKKRIKKVYTDDSFFG